MSQTFRWPALVPWLIIAGLVSLLGVPALVLALHHAVPRTPHDWTRYAPWVTWFAIVHAHRVHDALVGCAVAFGGALWLGIQSALATPRHAAQSRGAGIYGSAQWRTAASLHHTYVRWPESPSATQRRQRHAAKRGEPPTPAAGLMIGTMTTRTPPPKGGRPQFSAWVLHRDENALVLGTARSGKTRLVLLPTIGILGHAGESMVLNDPKGEICDTTATWLHQRGYTVVRADLRDPARGYVWNASEPLPAQPFRWNPLAVARQAWERDDESAAGQWVDDIVQGLLSTQHGSGGDDSQNAFWKNVAQSALSGIMLAMLADAPPDAAHLPAIQHLLGLPDEAINAWFAAMPPHALAAQVARTYLKTGGETRVNANSFTLSYLQPILSPAIQWLVSGATFDPLCLAQPDHPVALYVVSPDQRKAVDPLVTLFLQQLLQILAEAAAQSPARRLPIRVTLVLDEFGNIPPIPAFDRTVSVGLGRGIRLILALQSIAQLQRYDEGSRRTILDNCATWLSLGAGDLETAQLISQRMGQHDHAFTTRQHSAAGNGPTQTSWGQQTVGRALLTPDEVMRWPTGQGLVLQLRENAARTHLPDLSRWGFPWEGAAAPTPHTRTARPRFWPDAAQGETLPGPAAVPPPSLSASAMPESPDGTLPPLPEVLPF